jgi:hypothetical protein
LGKFLERELAIKEGIERYGSILSGSVELSESESKLKRSVKSMLRLAE